MERIPTGSDSTLFVFLREKEGDCVFVMANLSDKVQGGTLQGKRFVGDYKEIFTDEEKAFARKEEIRLKPWEYKVYVRK